ncbi:MAG: YfcC family protein [Spirochaetales bacterium]|nr:YfcC family protein [Spirochaetales bacterium]
MKKADNNTALLNISKKSFVQVTVLLLCLMVVAIAMTYFIPKGEFGTLADGSTDYLDYKVRSDLGGISLIKGILAPFLVFASGDGLTLIMLSLFLFVISASFQVMNDAGGVRSLVGAVSERFKNHRRALLVIISFLFYCFGSFLGLFEEMLTMLPIVTILCVLSGYDSFTGFLCCIISCAFGFAGAITNPFTVLLASEIIGANPMVHIWFRIVIFIVMFGLLMAFIALYVRRLEKDPSSSLTAQRDEAIRRSNTATDEQTKDPEKEKRLKVTYLVFLTVALALIIISSTSAALRSYTVVILIAYFLIFGLLAGTIATRDFPFVIRSFGKGFISAAPTIVFIALAASIKYIFDEGSVMPTIVHQINVLIEGRSPILIALSIYLIVLLLEFFISSSTAKAILVMGLLAMLNTGLSKQMLVLLYTFADGYTNAIFPTSPVLLISLSMIGVDYFKWVKKSAPLFAANVVLVIAFIILGVVIGY